MGLFKMDKIDKKILEVLANNAKINNVEMSKKIRLTAPATMQRIRKLQKSGIIIGFKTVFDKKKLGKGLSCFMAITVKSEMASVVGDLIENQLKKFREIEEIHLLTGRYDCLIKLHVRDVDELSEFMFKKLTKLKAFSHVETFISLKSIDNPNFSLIE
jgi:Lrp/AsnC family leucine-responsive transcriptional regulator